MTQTGQVTWFSDPLGYGFVRLDDGRQVYAHYTGINDAGRRKSLIEGQPVACDVVQGDRGLQAKNITVLKLAATVR